MARPAIDDNCALAVLREFADAVVEFLHWNEKGPREVTRFAIELFRRAHIEQDNGRVLSGKTQDVRWRNERTSTSPTTEQRPRKDRGGRQEERFGGWHDVIDLGR
jgi:hypothetical protein